MYQQNRSRYDELMREGKQMEETAKAVATNERKRSDSQVFNEMIDKMSNKMSNTADNETKSETKMVYIQSSLCIATHMHVSASPYFWFCDS